ncbi:MAG: hypothetical protein IKP68_05325, partial [Clostridia bacterium]|nr:hypothetical protein [Clostridia bacterium]
DDYDLESFRPLLLFKDFKAAGEMTTDTSFMTIADTPTLAVSGIIDDPVKPFTGKPINSDEKTAHVQYVSSSKNWETKKHEYVLNTGDADWYSVHDDVFDMNNWKNLGPANAEEGEVIGQ